MFHCVCLPHSCQGMVCCLQRVPLTLLTLPQSNWGVCFSMKVEGNQPYNHLFCCWTQWMLVVWASQHENCEGWLHHGKCFFPPLCLGSQLIHRVWCGQNLTVYQGGKTGYPITYSTIWIVYINTNMNKQIFFLLLFACARNFYLDRKNICTLNPSQSEGAIHLVTLTLNFCAL